MVLFRKYAKHETVSWISFTFHVSSFISHAWNTGLLKFYFKQLKYDKRKKEKMKHNINAASARTDWPHEIQQQFLWYEWAN